MKKIILIFVILGFYPIVAYCQSPIVVTDKLTKLFESKGFDTPECICADLNESVLYVSNIGGKNPEGKDNNGFISTITSEGELLELKWCKGLDAPKGMAIVGEYLYVTDIDKLVRIDIKSGNILEKIPVENARFLNDIGVLGNGDLIISDSKKGEYLKYSKGKITSFLSDKSFSSVNGVFVLGDYVITGVGDRLIKIDSSGKWENYITETGSVDGLSRVKQGIYIISDWNGKVHLVFKNKKKELILDTTPVEGVNAADFYYSVEKELLFIPTFFNNSVDCYKLNTD